MKASTYKRTPTWKLEGKKVKSTREIANGLGALPAGTTFTILRKYAGLELESDPCAHCGVQLRITRVDIGAVGDAYED